MLQEKQKEIFFKVKKGYEWNKKRTKTKERKWN